MAVGEHARNFAVPSDSPNTLFVPATTRIGTMKRNTGGVRNTERFPMTIDLFIDRSCLYFKKTYARRQNASSITPHFKASVQERLYGVAMKQALKPLVRWLTSHLQLLLCPQSCSARILTASLNLSDVPFDGYSYTLLAARFSDGLCFCYTFFHCLAVFAPQLFRSCFAHLYLCLLGRQSVTCVPS